MEYYLQIEWWATGTSNNMNESQRLSTERNQRQKNTYHVIPGIWSSIAEKNFYDAIRTVIISRSSAGWLGKGVKELSG